MTYTPDSLRGWASVIREYIYSFAGDSLDAHADAWEADLRRLAEAEGEADEWEQHIAALREALAQRSIEHLEALSANYALRELLWEVEDADTHVPAVPKGWADRRAALAPQEVTP